MTLKEKHASFLMEQAALGNTPTLDEPVIYDAVLYSVDGTTYYELFGNIYTFHHSAIRRGYVRKYRAQVKMYSGHFGTGIVIDLNNNDTRTFKRFYYIRRN